MNEIWVDVLTTAGPVALIAFACLWIVYQITMRWAKQVDELYTEVLKALGEVTEALRHINGKQ